MRPANSTCQWNITAPEGKVLRIEVHYVGGFDLPCDKEYLRIRDGPEESSKILAEYCRYGFRLGETEYIYSSGRSVWVETKKGTSRTRALFYYQAIDVEGKQKSVIP